MTLEDLPPLSAVLKTAGIDARRSLGQNFLLDLNLTRKIARAGGPLSDATVVEIGPGPGGLTRALLLEGAKRVVAIERDARFLPILEELVRHSNGRLSIIQADALKTNWAAIGVDTPARIIANLPYNVATELLTGWLEADPWPPWFDRAVLMFQREVAERIVARQGDPAYGRLAVLAGWRSHAHRMFDVPPEAFVPRPKVMSSIVSLQPKPLAGDAPAATMVKTLTAAAFGQRRKMLRSSLKSIFDDPNATLDRLGIAPTKRAEEIDISGFLALARAAEDASER